MSDLEKIKLSCSSIDDWSSSFSAVCRMLPPDLADQLVNADFAYLCAYGWPGAYERMNSRTLAQMIGEAPDLNVLAEGETDGIKYKLCEPGAPPRKTDKSDPGSVS